MVSKTCTCFFYLIWQQHDNNANSKAIKITFVNGRYDIVDNTKCILG